MTRQKFIWDEFAFMKSTLLYSLLLLIPTAFPEDSSGVPTTPLTYFLPEWQHPTNSTTSLSSSSSSYCFSNQTAKGQWIERPTVKAFRCCSPDYNDFRDPALIGYCTTSDENHTDLRWILLHVQSISRSKWIGWLFLFTYLFLTWLQSYLLGGGMILCSLLGEHVTAMNNNLLDKL